VIARSEQADANVLGARILTSTRAFTHRVSRTAMLSPSMSSHDITQFSVVDRTGDPAFFLHFLDEANKLSTVWKQPILDGLRLRPGAQVLDASCGMGADAMDLAAVVGENGHVTGVDFSETLIAEAIRRSANSNLSLSFEVGDAQALRFPGQSFDAVRTERMLMHVPNPEQALSELARVLRQRGTYGCSGLRLGNAVLRLSLQRNHSQNHTLLL
jgi:2-polyprenyl-3-methyl-5-hydroxy-6-metoxy-1,4-benzoquinol methylase